ncbi:thyrostimulin beta-5 subunit-like [Hyposmocoma kahamanoa]|uniref:thyrostimulin beta-5 subunit-like n=1 Tax=Hyposmocoma kahamanoa TaxID=1477025 RepID=UPI000E6D8EF1|nr:thyrostimulin beta-5 subunit-like [Hyposmocoma kahamanoa]
MASHKSSWSLAIAMFVCCWLSSSVASSGVGKCKLKVMTHKARQVDQFGYACEDDVKIYTCGGYCLSSEVPHWQFPYKESRHPVCQHDKVQHKHVRLTNCHPKADPSTSHYHFVEAATCKCKMCSSESTSCEWLPPGSSFLNSINLESEDMDDLSAED